MDVSCSDVHETNEKKKNTTLKHENLHCMINCVQYAIMIHDAVNGNLIYSSEMLFKLVGFHIVDEARYSIFYQSIFVWWRQSGKANMDKMKRNENKRKKKTQKISSIRL